MNPFGSGIAARDRFCNRVAEIDLLASVAEAGRFLSRWRVPTVKTSSSGLPITKRLLQAIAVAHPTGIFATAFLTAHRLGSQGGVQSSLAKLKKLDLVEQDEVGWRITDPIFCRWLAK